MGRPFRPHAAASAQGGTRVPLLAGVCASHRNPRSARLAEPVDRSHLAVPCNGASNLRQWMHVAALKCGLVRRCEHHTGRSAYPKPTRSRSVQPSSSTFGACASQRRRLFGTSRPPLPARNRTFSDWLASRWLRLLAPCSRIGPAKVLCRVPERSHYHVDRTRAPHGNTRSPSPGPALPPFGRTDTSVLQHCLVDVSQHSTKPWATARRVKHVPRVKYGGILAVAYDEHRRLVIERTIAKWRNSALRYRAVRKWRCASALLR